jgi:type VII secretion-associated protein (TIGR03931 family)
VAAGVNPGGARVPERVELGAGLLPAVPPRRRRGPAVRVTLAVTALGLLSGLLAARLPDRPAGAVTGPSVPAGVLAQYDYELALPAGWRHTGGWPERRRTLLTPGPAPAGSDLISVEQTSLGYDSAAEPDRAYRELRERYLREAAGGARLSGFTLSARFADREVIAYHQTQPLRGATVDWYVIFDRDLQLSVGCQHTPSGADAVRVACGRVVASLARRAG